MIETTLEHGEVRAVACTYCQARIGEDCRVRHQIYDDDFTHAKRQADARLFWAGYDLAMGRSRTQPATPTRRA